MNVDEPVDFTRLATPGEPPAEQDSVAQCKEMQDHPCMTDTPEYAKLLREAHPPFYEAINGDSINDIIAQFRTYTAPQAAPPPDAYNGYGPPYANMPAYQVSAPYGSSSSVSHRSSTASASLPY